MSIVAGAGAAICGLLLIRHRVAVARWQITYRVSVLRRSSLMNSEYVEREADSLRTAASIRLSGWLVAGFGGFVVVFGVLLAARGFR